MALGAPVLNRTPKAVDPNAQTAAGLLQQSGQSAQTVAPSGVAQPPTERQMATGGYSPTGTGNKTQPLVRAATNALTAGGQNAVNSGLPTGAIGATPNSATAGTPQAAAAAVKPVGRPPSVNPTATGGTPPPVGAAPAGSPDPGMPNTTSDNPSNYATNAAIGMGFKQPPSNGGANPVPNPYATIPLIPADENTIAGAQATYANQLAGLNQGMYGAAQAYGDPTVEGQWGLATPNPNSALALAALKAQQQQVADQNARGRNGTLFSSLAQTDLGNIGSQQQRADLAGYQKYQAALAKYASALATDKTNMTTSVGGAQADERQQALNNLTTPDQAAGGSAAGTNDAGTTAGPGVSNPKSTSKGAKVSKPPTIKTGTPPKTKTSVPKVSKVKK